MQVLLPEVVAMVGCAQPENFHPEGNVYVHTRLAVSMLDAGCSETLAFGVLLHNVAKPPCRAVTDGKTTFYGHTERGGEMAAEIMRRLKRSRFVQERVAYLVRDHLRLCMAPRMRPATLKRMLIEDGFDELLNWRGWTPSPPARTSASTISAAARSLAFQPRRFDLAAAD